MNDKILFVSPAKTYPVDESGRPFEPPRACVSLPALTILGSLESEGFDAEFIDLAAEGLDTITPLNKHIHRYGLADESVVQRIAEIKPLALLVTSMFSNEQRVVDDLTARVKKAYPKLPIIAGGIHATIKPNWLLEQGNIDIIIRGEGEEIIPKVLKQISLGKEISDRVLELHPSIQNLNRRWAFEKVLLKEDGSYRYDSRLSMRSDLYLHRTLLDWNRNFMLYYSKGCPTHCDFCATTERDGSAVRHMGSERMFQDFRMLHEKYGVNIFYNEADAFCFDNEDIQFLKKVKEYRKEHSDFVLNNPNGFYARVFFPRDKGYELDEEFLDLLEDSGFNAITISVETYNQRFNKKVDFNKITPNKIKRLVSSINKRGMKTEVYIMYAFPTETTVELLYDEKMGEDLGADVPSFHACTLLPGTKYYQEYVGKGRLFSESSYRERLNCGYTFYSGIETDFNFTNIQPNKLKDFCARHRLDF